MILLPLNSACRISSSLDIGSLNPGDNNSNAATEIPIDDINIYCVFVDLNFILTSFQYFASPSGQGVAKLFENLIIFVTNPNIYDSTHEKSIVMGFEVKGVL
ncbi:hypothetical protein JCM12294_43710 [Desulfocicer niacini]